MFVWMCVYMSLCSRSILVRCHCYEDILAASHNVKGICGCNDVVLKLRLGLRMGLGIDGYVWGMGWGWGWVSMCVLRERVDQLVFHMWKRPAEPETPAESPTLKVDPCPERVC